jgi:glycosyltransferase involved in cell wall biosynthesis
MIKFSILLPCYNGEKYLEQAINSVLNQDYKNWELIIIDKKSMDNSHEIINTYCELDTRIKWLKYKDKGISDALNYALDFAQGDIIGYLGSDDYYNTGIFKKIANFLNKYKDFFWVYGNSYNVYLSKKFELLIEPGYFSYNALFLGNFVGLQNVFFNKDILMLYKFDENNIYSMDYELWFRLFKKYKPFYIQEVISYNIQENNISSGSRTDLQRIEADNVAKKYVKTIWQKILVLSYKFPILRWKLLRFYRIFLSIQLNLLKRYQNRIIFLKERRFL